MNKLNVSCFKCDKEFTLVLPDDEKDLLQPMMKNNFRKFQIPFNKWNESSTDFTICRQCFQQANTHYKK